MSEKHFASALNIATRTNASDKYTTARLGVIVIVVIVVVTNDNGAKALLSRQDVRVFPQRLREIESIYKYVYHACTIILTILHEAAVVDNRGI